MFRPTGLVACLSLLGGCAGLVDDVGSGSADPTFVCDPADGCPSSLWYADWDRDGFGGDEVTFALCDFTFCKGEFTF